MSDWKQALHQKLAREKIGGKPNPAIPPATKDQKHIDTITSRIRQAAECRLQHGKALLSGLSGIVGPASDTPHPPDTPQEQESRFRTYYRQAQGAMVFGEVKDILEEGDNPYCRRLCDKMRNKG